MSLLHTSLMFKENIKSDYLGEEIINLLDKTFVIPQYYNYNIFNVTEKYIARPDLVSYDAYNDVMYADVICKLNGISNPFELNEGMKLILPSPEYITEFIVRPPTSEREAGNDNNQVPVAKTKKDKRKPSEALVGDSRFKIDKTKGIIIY